MKFRNWYAVLGHGFLTSLVGCTVPAGPWSEPSATNSVAPLTHDGGLAMMVDRCPVQIPGTSVSSVNVDGGVALSFVNSAGNVNELRQVVLRMSERHNRRFARGGVMMDDHQHMNHPGSLSGERTGMNAPNDGKGEGGIQLPAATATAEDIDGGAQLMLHAASPADVETIRAHARMRVNRMASGDCPIMSPNAPVRPRPVSNAGSLAQ